jgi:hypothetical protein
VIQEKYTASPPSYDWSDKGFTEGLFVLLLWGKYHLSSLNKSILPKICDTPLTKLNTEFSQQALQNWLYYLVSTMTDNISELGTWALNSGANVHKTLTDLASSVLRYPPWTGEFFPGCFVRNQYP